MRLSPFLCGFWIINSGLLWPFLCVRTGTRFFFFLRPTQTHSQNTAI
jgi:hypothetical protein